jgi:hypothetical protein
VPSDKKTDKLPSGSHWCASGFVHGVDLLIPRARDEYAISRWKESVIPRDLRTARNAEPADPAIRTTHLCRCILEWAFDRDLIRGGHYGQRPCVPRQ